MIAPLNFSDYTLDSYDFNVDGMYNLVEKQVIPYYPPLVIYTPPVTVAPAVIQPIQAVVQPAQPIVVRKTIQFTVADAKETLPGANIAVDGVGKAQTDGNGFVTLPNIAMDSIITVSFVGYGSYTVLASQIPNRVILNEDITMLDEVKIYTKKPTSNTWAWWLVGTALAAGIYKYSKTGAKVVRAKI